jgi:hypothetical protein
LFVVEWCWRYEVRRKEKRIEKRIEKGNDANRIDDAVD